MLDTPLTLTLTTPNPNPTPNPKPNPNPNPGRYPNPKLVIIAGTVEKQATELTLSSDATSVTVEFNFQIADIYKVCYMVAQPWP